MSDNRSTQFSGFAKALSDELAEVEKYHLDTFYINPNDKYYREQWQKIIARRAYDLAVHTLESVRPMAFQRWPETDDIMDDVEDVIGDIPDLTDLPKEQESSYSGEYRVNPLTWREREDAIRNWKPPIQKEQE